MLITPKKKKSCVGIYIYVSFKKRKLCLMHRRVFVASPLLHCTIYLGTMQLGPLLSYTHSFGIRPTMHIIIRCTSHWWNNSSTPWSDIGLNFFFFKKLSYLHFFFFCVIVTKNHTHTHSISKVFVSIEQIEVDGY